LFRAQPIWIALKEAREMSRSERAAFWKSCAADGVAPLFRAKPASAIETKLPGIAARQHMRADWMLLVVAAFLFVFFGKSYAQIDTGSVTGTVKDPTGAVVVGAQCTLTNTATNIAQKIKSTSAGAYTFEAVPAGLYSLKVVAPGFKEYELNNIQIHVQTTLTADVSLQLGSIGQEVTVTSAVPLLQAQDASVGMTISNKMTNDLPLQGGSAGRNFMSLTTTSPGVYANSGAGMDNTSNIVAMGVENGQVDLRLNGVDDNEEFFGGTSIVPIPDAIQEFKFMDGNNSAEFGHSTGAVINAVTYSGTNDFKGRIWEYFGNEDLNANDYFNKLNNKPRPEYRHNEFGGLIGGPVLLPHYNGKNRTFFFFDFQRTMHTTVDQYTQTVPTATMQKTDFTNMQDLLTVSKSTHKDALGRTFQYGTIFDPATTRQLPASGIDPVTGLTGTPNAYVRDPFYSCTTSGCPANDNMQGNTTTDYTTASQLPLLNILPSSRLDPNAVAMLGLLPVPNESSANISNNWFNIPLKTTDTNQYDGRVDEKISDKDSIWGTYDHENPVANAATAYPGPAEGALSVDYATTQPIYMVVTSWTHIFSPALINEFRFGVNNNYTTRLDPYANVLGLPSKYGVQGIAQNPGNGGLPFMQLNVISNFGAHRFAPTIQTTRVFEYEDNLTRIVGKHELKFGGQYDHLMSDIIQPAYPRGYFVYNGQYSDIPNNNASENGMADMLLTPIAADSYYQSAGGAVSSATNAMGGLGSFEGSNYAQSNYHAPYIGIYGQDNWKLTPDLTFNIGVRWDYFGAYASDGGQEANLVMGGNGYLSDGNGLGAYYLIGHDGCSTSLGANFTGLLAALNIPIVCSPNNAVARAQRDNFAPRLGIAYRITPTIVARAGAGVAYGALDSVGYGGTLGTNYPFQFNYTSPSTNTSQVPLIIPGTTSTATMENTFGVISLANPTLVNPAGLGLTGKNYFYQTPQVTTLNFQLQWQFTKHDSIQSGYVGNLGKHLDSPSTTHNSPSEMLIPGTPLQTINYTNPAASTGAIPYPALGATAEFQMTNMISSYQSWQTVYLRQFVDGSSVGANYTFSRCLSDNIGKTGLGQGIRALWLPGMGARADYTLCNDDATHLFNANGEFAVPVGRGSAYFSDVRPVTDAFVSGWHLNFIFKAQSGQPFNVGCQNPSQGSLFGGGFGCNAPLVPGQKIYIKTRQQWVNPAAFTRLPYTPVTTNGANNLDDLGVRGNQVRGPGFYDIDASLHKQFDTGENTKFEFRLETLNLFNHVEFNNPGNTNFTQTAPGQFGAITGDRLGVGRVVQLAGKWYF
jgi:carboxypeptidase family protein/TonB-dependent receptor-like protein